MFKFGDFIRDCYLQAVPSIDLNDVSKDNPIDCCDYHLKTDLYDDILNQYCENDEERKMCNMWMLQSGPQLVEV